MYQPNPTSRVTRSIFVLNIQYLLIMKSSILTLILTLLFGLPILGQVDIKINNEGVLFTDKADTVLFYQKIDKSLNGTYARANYIHPLFTLDGVPMTEDFPPDHLHQRGIFWAWHQLYIGDKRIGDGWDIRDIRWDVTSLSEQPRADGAKEILTSVEWKSPLWTAQPGEQKPIVHEHTRIIVYPSTSSFRLVDFEISLLGLEPEMRIGGSENEKGYGGFTTRVRLPYDVQFDGMNGKVTPENTPVIRWSMDQHLRLHG